MKKLQRFGIVSLAAMTLGTLTLSQEVKVMAEENPPVEATTVDDQPISNESISNEEASDSPQESDNVVDETAETETQPEEENSQSSEAADETSTESTETNSDSVNQRLVFYINSRFHMQGYEDFGKPQECHLEKGESLSVSNFLKEDNIWEVESIKLDPDLPSEVTLKPFSVLSYDDLIKRSNIIITYKAKDFRPNSPKTSQIGEKGENAYLSIRVNHYLVTNEGLALIDTEFKGLDHEKPSFSPTYRTDYLNLEPLAGASLLKDFHRIEPFTVGDSINFNDMTLKKNATLNLYYQKKGDKVSDYYNKPVLELKQRSFQVLHVDENGQNIAEASKDYFILDNTARIIKGVTVKVPSREYKGYKARKSEIFVSYDDLGDDFINSIRLVYDTVEKEAIEPIELVVRHFFSDGYYTTGFEKNTITIKPGESVTLQPKSIEGFHTLQDSVTLAYDQVSKIDKSYSFFYRKNNQEWPTRDKEWLFNVVHVLDDGATSLYDLVDKSELVDTFTLKPGGSPVVPTFKVIEGWVPDLSRSFQRIRFRGGGFGVSIANYEQGVAHQYGTVEYGYVALVYKKADTSTGEATDNNDGEKPVISTTDQGGNVSDTTQPVGTVPSTPTDTLNTSETVEKPSEDSTDTPSTDQGGNVSDTTQPVDTVPSTPSDSSNTSETEEKPSEDSTDTPSTNQGGNVSDTTQPVGTVPDVPSDPSNTTETGEKPSEDNADKPNTDQGEDVSDTTQPVDTVLSTPSDSSNTSDTVEKATDDSTDTPSTDQDGDVFDTTQPIGIVINDKIVNNTLLIPHCIGEEFDTVRLELAEKTGEMLVTSIASSESLTMSQTLSRVESRHLPETSDRKNSFVLFGLAILGLLGIHQPNRSRRIRH